VRSSPVTVRWTGSLMKRWSVGKYLLREGAGLGLARLAEDFAQTLDGAAEMDGDGLG
jgi:hypothetical protein